VLFIRAQASTMFPLTGVVTVSLIAERHLVVSKTVEAEFILAYYLTPLSWILH